MLKTRTFQSGLLSFLICLSSLTLAAEMAVPQQVPETSNLSISITCLDIEAAQAAIIDDSIDPYFSRMQEMEMSAKTGSPIDGNTIEEQRQNCRQRYQAGVREFTDDEKKVIRMGVEKLYPSISEKYPLFAEMPWGFIKVSDEIEGGMPHTRDKYIVLSEGVCRQFAMMHQSAPERALSSMAGLFLHEQMHVFQRLHPNLFDSLYIDVWGFIKAEKIESCPWLDKHQLINPDGTDCCWVYPIKKDDDVTYLWPLVVFAEGDGLKSMPGDFRMIGVELDRDDGIFKPIMTEDGKPVYHNLMDVPEYRNIFPQTSNIYHPNEASASLFTLIVLLDSMPEEQRIAQQERMKIGPNFELVRKWFAENLQKKSEN